MEKGFLLAQVRLDDDDDDDDEQGEGIKGFQRGRKRSTFRDKTERININRLAGRAA